MHKKREDEGLYYGLNRALSCNPVRNLTADLSGVAPSGIDG
jgi:hypothetical protein